MGTLSVYEKRGYAVWLVLLYQKLGVDYWDSIIKMAEALECLPQFHSWRKQWFNSDGTEKRRRKADLFLTYKLNDL
jgi:hypothetical protein